MSTTKSLALLSIFLLFSTSISRATPYISMNASIDLTKSSDTSGAYNFTDGRYNLSIVFHGEGLLNEINNADNAYYRFDRNFVDIKINGIKIEPLYHYYNTVRASYSKTDRIWSQISALTVDQENYRSGTVNQDYLLLSPSKHSLRFQDITQLIPENGESDIELVSTRYDYTGAIDSFSYQLSEFTTNPSPVPEPATFLLLGSGLAGLAFYRRKRK